MPEKSASPKSQKLAAPAVRCKPSGFARSSHVGSPWRQGLPAYSEMRTVGALQCLVRAAAVAAVNAADISP
jgi:hypothetical protein